MDPRNVINMLCYLNDCLYKSVNFRTVQAILIKYRYSLMHYKVAIHITDNNLQAQKVSSNESSSNSLKKILE
jgi:hypothetical protein